MDNLTKAEKDIIKLYRQLSSEDQGEFRGIIEAFAHTTKKKVMLILALSKLREVLST